MKKEIIIAPPRTSYPYRVNISCYSNNADSILVIVDEMIKDYGGCFVIESCYGGVLISCQFNCLENAQWFYKTIMLDFT